MARSDFQIARGIRKARISDIYFKNPHLSFWTAELDGELEILLSDHSIASAARSMGITPERARKRAKFLGIKPVPEIDRATPSKAEWKAAASRKAQEWHCRVEDVLSGARHRSACMARWEAWREVLESDHNYSSKGLSRVSGFDHSTILTSLKRLREIESSKAG